jgi:predicted XRE-type DNA-binding protein
MERSPVAKGTEEVTFEVGSGNVYADLGYRDPEQMVAKAALVRQIRTSIDGLGLSQSAAARLIGIDQPTLSKLLRGAFRNITIDRLSSMLRHLGRNLTIIVEPATYPDPSLGAQQAPPPMGHFEVRPSRSNDA